MRDPWSQGSLGIATFPVHSDSELGLVLRLMVLTRETDFANRPASVGGPSSSHKEVWHLPLSFRNSGLTMVDIPHFSPGTSPPEKGDTTMTLCPLWGQQDGTSRACTGGSSRVTSGLVLSLLSLAWLGHLVLCRLYILSVTHSPISWGAFGIFLLSPTPLECTGHWYCESSVHIHTY